MSNKREGPAMRETKRKYDATVARIAGNLLSGYAQQRVAIIDPADRNDTLHIEAAVRLARRIVTETIRTEPEPSDAD